MDSSNHKWWENDKIVEDLKRLQADDHLEWLSTALLLQARYIDGLRKDVNRLDKELFLLKGSEER